MASTFTFWVGYFERRLPFTYLHCLPRSSQFVRHVRTTPTSTKHEDVGDAEPRRYDRRKMAKLFDSVRSLPEDVDDVVSAEFSGMASSVAGICWHRAALSEMVEPETSNANGPEGRRNDARNTAEDVNETPYFTSEDDVSCNLGGSDSVKSDRENDEATAGFAMNEQKDAIIREMQLLMQNERKERERVREMLSKQQKLRIGNAMSPGRDVSTMKLLTIAKEISGRNPAHGKPQLDEKRDRRERAYYRNLQRSKAAAQPEDKGYYKQSWTDGRDLVRVLDVDQLPLPLLHHMLCYSLVKHMPAEAVLQVISRIAMLRDNNSHVAYQNFLRDIGKIASPICRAEVVALLSRGYQSVSVPFMVDYVRRFGTFSRRFMAKLIQRHAQPQALDFLRYRAGQRQINQILTRPWALFGYVKMLKKSSAKTYMYHNLLARGYVPNETVFDRFHAFGTLDPGMANTILNSQKLLNDTVSFSEHTPKPDANRPSMYDTVLEAQALGLPLEDLVEESAPIKSDDKADDVALPSRMSTQLVKIQTQLPHQQPPTTTTGFRDVDDDLPANRSNITWTTPWGRRRDVFHFRGKTYTLDPDAGWKMSRSAVRPHYLKNIQMNKRKARSKALRRSVAKRARQMLAERMT
ncbi:hypothetical protein, conserved [Babesia ovata]|uniref:Uncharacterized protein n=1 Tax=Babesia ovata TaxID=189622 RepID=A0A2H6KJ92_9APIC|nr:uncharacterized protein BOVATA_045550 [Babesia ovata]GBE63062.1 hypothetical protein, conserved [Babesia ovata]